MLKITAVPAFRDNYIWALQDPDVHPHAVILVDPGEPGAILAWLDAQHAHPAAVLITHHHNDHTGALPQLAARWNMPVYGPGDEGIAGVTHPVRDGDFVTISALKLSFKVLATPGHTLGHVCYFGEGRLFSGDTLFSCGCGRLFEGSAAQMHASLQRLTQLPADTLIYCAHEYTLPNMGFAQEVDPKNADLEAYYQAAKTLRRAKRPTLPSTLSQELACNPFLRCHTPAIRAAILQQTGETPNTDTAAFAALRQWKNIY